MQIGLIIPQLFYDCIARIVPGTIMMISIYVIWGENILGTFWRDVEVKSFFFVFIFLMVVYIISFLIEGFIKLVENLKTHSSHDKTKIWNESIDSIVHDYNQTKTDLLNLVCPVNRYMAYDFIRMVNPEAGSRIVKLRAEKNMCENLKYGWWLLGIVYVLRIFFILIMDHAWNYSVSEMIGVILGLAICIWFIDKRRSNLNVLFSRAIFNHWTLIQTLDLSSISDKFKKDGQDAKENASQIP